MELNWTTFILEIINFLILVWIMKRFFYKPVLGVIARRRAAIEDEQAGARELKAEGEQLQQQYEHRLSDWDQERQHAREQLRAEIDEERARLMQGVDEALEQAREKAQVTEQHRLQEHLSKAEEDALQHGVRFASRLLEQVAGPELETRLVEVLLGELEQIPAARLEALRSSWGEPPMEIVVTSAYALSPVQQQQLEQALREVTRLSQPLHYVQDPQLLAGLRIGLGAWVLGFNLRDELHGFAELAHDG